MVAFVMNGLAEKGYNVSVLTYNNYSVGQSLHDTIHFYQGKPQSGLKEYCYAVKRIKEVIIDFNPNVIVAFRDNASALAVKSISKFSPERQISTKTERLISSEAYAPCFFA